MKRIALFPGSFDPITRGHESIIKRALPLFDEIIVAIGENTEKKSYFSIEQRMAWIDSIFSAEPRVRTVKYSGLTVDYCKANGISFILRGLRTSSDFEFERSIGQMNKLLDPQLETIFLLCSPEYASLSSSIVREIIRYGGDVSKFIPEGINVS